MPTRIDKSHLQEWRQRLISTLPLRYRQYHAMYTWGEGDGENWKEVEDVKKSTRGRKSDRERPNKGIKKEKLQTSARVLPDQQLQCTCIPHTEQSFTKEDSKNPRQETTRREMKGNWELHANQSGKTVTKEGFLRSRRLDKIASNHHLPRIFQAGTNLESKRSNSSNREKFRKYPAPLISQHFGKPRNTRLRSNSNPSLNLTGSSNQIPGYAKF